MKGKLKGNKPVIINRHQPLRWIAKIPRKIPEESYK